MLSCPLCRAIARTTLYRGTRSGDVHRCTACGFVYSDPPALQQKPRLPHYKDHPEAYSLNTRHRLGVLAKATGITKGSLLDVGCFDGSFMLAAKEFGFDVQGIEPEVRAAATARERGLEVMQTNYEEADFSQTFDVITFMHSLEHVPDPWAALVKARNLLKPEGALLIEIPNFNCWSRRIMGRRWRQFIHDHLQFFEPATLLKLMEKTGYEVRLSQTVGKIASIGLVADRLERYYSSALGRGLRRLAESCRITERTLTLNLGDIMLAVATVHRSG